MKKDLNIFYCKMLVINTVVYGFFCLLAYLDSNTLYDKKMWYIFISIAWLISFSHIVVALIKNNRKH